jgi:DNA polymerase-1
LYIPRRGYTFVGGDYSDLEGRLTALYSGDETMCRLYVEGMDLHAYLAHMIWPEVPPEKKLADSVVKYESGMERLSARYLAKRGGHGIRYGMEAEGVSRHLHIPLDLARKLYENFHDTYQRIREYQRDVIHTVWGRYDEESGMWDPAPQRSLETVYGRVRWFWCSREQGKDKALSFLPQSTGSSIWYKLVERITQPGCSLLPEPWDGRVVTGTYDSVCCEVREDQADDFARWLKDRAEEENPPLSRLPGAALMGTRIPFDVSAGEHYGRI